VHSIRGRYPYYAPFPLSRTCDARASISPSPTLSSEHARTLQSTDHPIRNSVAARAMAVKMLRKEELPGAGSRTTTGRDDESDAAQLDPGDTEAAEATPPAHAGAADWAARRADRISSSLTPAAAAAAAEVAGGAAGAGGPSPGGAAVTDDEEERTANADGASPLKSRNGTNSAATCAWGGEGRTRKGGGQGEEH